MPIKEIIRGSHFLAIISSRMGICSNMGCYSQHIRDKGPLIPKSTQELASLLLDQPPDFPEASSYAIAAINSLLPVPKDAFPLKAQDLIRQKGQGKNVVIIGHFPFVEKMGREFRNLWVLEIRPQAGDLPAEAATKLLPHADVIALTATTLLNGTCANILGLIPKGAFTIMVGPSTPFVSCLFDWGIDALAGCSVLNTSLATSCVLKGLPFTPLHGFESLIWTGEKNSSTI